MRRTVHLLANLIHGLDLLSERASVEGVLRTDNVPANAATHGGAYGLMSAVRKTYRVGQAKDAAHVRAKLEGMESECVLCVVFVWH